MDYKKIGEEKLLGARLYMPLGKKMEFVAAAAVGCLDNATVQLTNGSTLKHAKEATDRKSRYLMGALVGYYLNDKDFSPVEDTAYLMAQDDYDRWAGGHIFNQLERFKSNSKTRDFAFDLLWDYRDLEKRLNTEIYNLLQALNDPVVKLTEEISLSATPEAMQEAMRQLEEVKGALDAYKENEKDGGAE